VGHAQQLRNQLAMLLQIRAEALKYGPRDFVAVKQLESLKREEVSLEAKIRAAEKREAKERMKEAQ
jgi:hypothetical protein